MNDPIKHFLSFYDNYATREDMDEAIALGNLEEDDPYFQDLEAFESIKDFIEKTYELAFGHDAINRNFGHAEVIEQLEEFNEDSLKWDSIPDDEKEEYENAFYEVPDKEDLAE